MQGSRLTCIASVSQSYMYKTMRTLSSFMHTLPLHGCMHAEPNESRASVTKSRSRFSNILKLSSIYPRKFIALADWTHQDAAWTFWLWNTDAKSFCASFALYTNDRFLRIFLSYYTEFSHSVKVLASYLHSSAWSHTWKALWQTERSSATSTYIPRFCEYAESIKPYINHGKRCSMGQGPAT